MHVLSLASTPLPAMRLRPRTAPLCSAAKLNRTTLHTHPASRGKIVEWYLEELGGAAALDVDVVTVDMSAQEHLEPAFLAVSPFGKLPALSDSSGLSIFESGALLLHLHDRFKSPSPSPDERSRTCPAADRGCASTRAAPQATGSVSCTGRRRSSRRRSRRLGLYSSWSLAHGRRCSRRLHARLPRCRRLGPVRQQYAGQWVVPGAVPGEGNAAAHGWLGGDPQLLSFSGVERLWSRGRCSGWTPAVPPLHVS